MYDTPMSQEGFLALTTEVLSEWNDATTTQTMARMGLPGKPAVGFLSRMTATLTPYLVPADEKDAKTIEAIGDIFLIGLLVGHKAGQWQREADDARAD